MTFSVDTCKIPVAWCGNGKIPNKDPNDLEYYHHSGSRYECFKKGFGAGMSSKSRRPREGSLREIKYIGSTYAEKFRRQNIKNLEDLYTYVEKNEISQIKKLLDKIFTKSDGNIDSKAYNSTILHLYFEGISVNSLPDCKKIL